MVDRFVQSKQMTQNQRDMIHWGARYAVYEWHEEERQAHEAEKAIAELAEEHGIDADVVSMLNVTPESQEQIVKAMAQIEAGDFDLIEDFDD